MHTDGAAPRWEVTGPAGQRDYELMVLGCPLLRSAALV